MLRHSIESFQYLPVLDIYRDHTEQGQVSISLVLDYDGALKILKKQSDMELYYKFSPLLMQYIPKETVTAWIMKSSELEPMKLIPALVQYDHDTVF
jgi:protein involved in sex pheromone biosynthesis